MTPKPPALLARAFVALAGLAILAAGCGSEEALVDRQLSGAVREPAPEVGSVALPDTLADGAPTPFRAEAGGLLLVYFGYTHCPDICPTTLVTLDRALERLPSEERARVEVAMVTVDPVRDTATVLASHVEHFLDDAATKRAMRTDDEMLLEEAKDAFGVTSYLEPYGPGPDEYEVAHSAQVFVVDDEGSVVLEWTFGTESEPIAEDIRTLLAREDAASESAHPTDRRATTDPEGADGP